MLLSSLDAELGKDGSEIFFGPINEWSLNFSLQNEQTKSWTFISDSESGKTLSLPPSPRVQKGTALKSFREKIPLES